MKETEVSNAEAAAVPPSFDTAYSEQAYRYTSLSPEKLAWYEPALTDESTAEETADEQWDALLTSPESVEMLIAMADKAMADFDAGLTIPLGVSAK